MRSITIFARRVASVTATFMLMWGALYTLGVPSDMPGWRITLGLFLMAVAAIVFEKGSDQNIQPEGESHGN